MIAAEPAPQLLDGIEGDDGGLDLEAVSKITGLPPEEIDEIEHSLSAMLVSERQRQIFYGVACWLARAGVGFYLAEDVFAWVESMRDDPQPHGPC